MKKLLIVIAILVSIQTLLADGVIIPIESEPTPMPGRPPWPKKTYLHLKNHYVNIDIHNNICRVEVEETFYNPYDFQMEGEYIFPIPKNGMPSKFSLIVNGKEMKGEVLERNEARRIYEDIVRRMRDPGLLEYYEHNMFRARVFPILPKKDLKTVVRYEYKLPRKGEFYEIFYPFKIEGLSPEPIKNVAISFNIKSDLPIKQVFSPTHDIDLSKKENSATGAFEATRLKPNKDFIIYYSVSRKDFDLSVLSYKKKDDDGFFLLGISAPAEPPKKEVLPKDIVFVIDCSGSMSGEKITQAKKGLNFFVNNLNPDDRFNIIAFSSSLRPFKTRPVPATKTNIMKAKRFIKKLKAKGGTNINASLLKGLKMLGKTRPSYILFLTDGLPTVGVTSLDKIVGHVTENIERERLFVFGVGYDVNTILLDKLSEVGKGVSEYIEPKEDLELAMSSLYSKIMYPALEEPEIEFLNVDVYKVHPDEIGDIFYGQDIIVAGRFEGRGKGQIVLKAKRRGKEVVFEESFDFPDEDEDLDFIPLIWARKQVGYLLSEIRLHGEEKELVDEVIELGKRYGIVTPYTSYLVTEDERLAMPLARSAEEFKTEATGRGGVSIAKDLDKMKSGMHAQAPGIASIKQVGEKTFFLKDGVYVDGEYKEGMSTRTVKFGSYGYFNLLKRYPTYARYFSLNTEIIVVIKGTAYKVII